MDRTLETDLRHEKAKVRSLEVDKQRIENEHAILLQENKDLERQSIEYRQDRDCVRKMLQISNSKSEVRYI